MAVSSGPAGPAMVTSRSLTLRATTRHAISPRCGKSYCDSGLNGPYERGKASAKLQRGAAGEFAGITRGNFSSPRLIRFLWFRPGSPPSGCHVRRHSRRMAFFFRLRRSHVASDQSMTTGVAERYASALFDLAKEQGQHVKVEQDLNQFQAMIDSSADLLRVVRSPAFSAEEQGKAVSAVAAKAGIGGLVANFLKVLASNRRLFALPEMIQNFRLIAAKARGEISADVTSAHPLSAAQIQALKDQLKSGVGKDVTLNAKVDPALLGGLVVKVGSRMIDNSLRTKLDQLKIAMKGTG